MRDVPLALFRAWEEHSEALLREYLLVVAGRGGAYDLRDVAQARQARILLSGCVADADSQNAHVDVLLKMADPVAASDFATLQAILDEATRMAKQGDLLTLPGLPEIIAVRNWMCDQIVAQSAGAPATAWDIELAGRGPAGELAHWPGMDDLPEDTGWLVGDDANHIIGASNVARELLGWVNEDIVGQRIMAVIPPDLRQHHIAGFSHAIVTGEHRILGQTVELNAWTYDGREVPVTLRLERKSGNRGRVVYVAWLQARS